MKKQNKKALATFKLIILIISIITFLVLIYVGNSIVKDVGYQNSVVECSYFFSNINGKKAFFTNLKIPNSNLINSISNLCPSKKIIIDKNKINKVSNLISDCWKKTKSGKNILPSKISNSGICLYCGRIKTNNEIKDFSTLLNNKLKNKKYSFLYNENQNFINLNKITLNTNSIPKTISNKNSISVFYYTFKPETSNIDKIQSWFSTWISSNIQFTSGLEEKFTSSDVKTYSGILLTNQKDYQEGEILNLDRNNLNYKKCKLIIPKKNYN